MSAQGLNSRSSGRATRQSVRDEDSDPLGSLRSPLRPESSRVSARDKDSKLSEDGRTDGRTERTKHTRDQDSSDIERRYTRSRRSEDSRSNSAGYTGHLELDHEGRKPRLSAKERLGGKPQRSGGHPGHSAKAGYKEARGHSDKEGETSSAATSVDWGSIVEMEEAEEVERKAKRPSSVDSSSTAGEDGTGSARKSSRVPKVLETDLLVIARRQKQLEYGLSTPEYKQYLKVVPRKDRTRHHPSTPDKNISYSRRGWDTMIKIWRKELHVWDPEAAKKQPISDTFLTVDAKIPVLIEKNTSINSVTKANGVPTTDHVIKAKDVTVDDHKIAKNMLVGEVTTHDDLTKAENTPINDIKGANDVENMSVDDVTKACEAAIRSNAESMQKLYESFALTTEPLVSIAADDSNDNIYDDL